MTLYTSGVQAAVDLHAVAELRQHRTRFFLVRRARSVRSSINRHQPVAAARREVTGSFATNEARPIGGRLVRIALSASGADHLDVGREAGTQDLSGCFSSAFRGPACSPAPGPFFEPLCCILARVFEPCWIAKRNGRDDEPGAAMAILSGNLLGVIPIDNNVSREPTFPMPRARRGGAARAGMNERCGHGVEPRARCVRQTRLLFQ